MLDDGMKNKTLIIFFSLGMLAATSLAIFIVPVLFVVIIRIAYGKKKLEELRELGEFKEQGKPAI